jgi:hypothetical protein
MGILGFYVTTQLSLISLCSDVDLEYPALQLRTSFRETFGLSFCFLGARPGRAWCFDHRSNEPGHSIVSLN